MNLENPLLQGIQPTAGAPAGVLLAETDPSGQAGSRLTSIPGLITQAAGPPNGSTPTVPPLYIDNTTGVLYWYDGAAWITLPEVIVPVGTVDDLALLSNPLNGGLYQTKGYYVHSDGGPNLYRYIGNSIQACDGGFVVDGIGGDNSPGATAATYPGTGTGRFVALDQSVANAKLFGAKGDGATDDVYRLQAAVNAVVSAGGGHVYLPNGDYRLIAAPLIINGDNVRLSGQHKRSATIRSATVDVIQMGEAGGTSYSMTFEQMGVISDAGGGHCFVNKGGGSAGSTWEKIFVQQVNANKNILRAISAEVSGGTVNYIDNTWRDFDARHAIGATVPSFYLVTSGSSINRNTWENGRNTYSGDYVYHIETTATGVWVRDNVFRDINFEVTTGGCVRAIGSRGLAIEHCKVYDTDVIGNITKDLILLDTPTGGLETTDTSINGFSRVGGTLDPGIFDIKFANGTSGNPGLFIYNTRNSSGSAFAVNLGSANAVIIHASGPLTVTSPGFFTQIIDGGGIQQGGSGTRIREHYSATAVLDFPTIAAGATQVLTMALPNARTTEPVVAVPAYGLETGLVWSAFVSANDVVTIRLHNGTTGTSIDPASRTWRVSSWGY